MRCSCPDLGDNLGRRLAALFFWSAIAAAAVMTASTPALAIEVRRGQPTPTRTMNDVAYGTLPEQRLDVYQGPAGERHDGAIVYIHGGGWIGGDEDLLSLSRPHVITSLATEQGWTVFSVRYRLAPDPDVPGDTGAPFPAALLDVNQAVRWVKANASQFGIDPTKVVVYGWSAGGHLAALLGTTWNVPALQPTGLGDALAKASPRPAAVVSIAGPLDPKAWGDSNPDPHNVFSGGAVIASFAGCSGSWYTSCTAAQLRAIDVSTYADRSDPGMYIAHGDLDGIVSPAQQQPVAARLATAIGASKVAYDLTSKGPAADRNHLPDAALDRAGLVRFLDRARSFVSAQTT